MAVGHINGLAALTRLSCKKMHYGHLLGQKNSGQNNKVVCIDEVTGRQGSTA